AAAALTAVVAWHGVVYAVDRGTLVLKDGERKYATVGEYIAARLPERAIIIAIQHSGSARYYSGRLTIRWDFIEPQSLDGAIGVLRRVGAPPYFLLEPYEESDFLRRFAGSRALHVLDLPPVAQLRGGSGPRIYDVEERAAAPAVPDVID